MAKPKDTEIERLLRRVVKDAVKKEEAITIKLARSRVETELGLEDGFFKNDGEWKGRSKAIIEAAFEEEDEPDENVTTTPAKSISKSKPVETPRFAAQEVNKRPKAQQRSEKASAKSTQPVVSPSKPKEQVAEKSAAARDDESGDDDSEESSEDEEDESGSATNEAQISVTTTPKKPEKTAPKVNGVKRKADDQSGPDATDSGSDHEEDVEDEHKSKKAKTKSSTSEEENSIGEDDEGSDEDGHDDDDDDEEEEGEGEEAEAEAQTKDTQSQEATEEPPQVTLQAIPPKPFKPPAGFTLLGSDQLHDSAAFSSANLDGKQLWYITAPSTLPLSSITEIALDAIQSGTPILTHDNIDYVLHEDQTQTNDNVALLVPTEAGYERVDQKIERTLQIQQKITLPNLTVRQASRTTGSNAAADIAQPPITTVRPQPKGLRMRYKPPGFGPGKPGRIGSGSDSMEGDEDDQPPSKATFQFPRVLGAHGTSMQETAGGALTNADVEMSSPKKAKKKKKRKDKESAGGSQALANGLSASPEARAATSAKKTVETPGSALPNGVGPESSSREEKARRKEEKRLKRERKEAKRKSQDGTG